MKIRIEAAPGEFEEKREQLIKTLQELTFEKSTRAWNGLTISFENGPGSVRAWGDEEAGEHTLMQFAYGEILGTQGADGDPYDVYVGPNPDEAKYVYVVHQQDPETGKYDEDKAMIGFNSPSDAYQAYTQHYDRADHFQSMSALRVGEFVQKVRLTETGVVKSFVTDALFSYEPLADRLSSHISAELASDLRKGEALFAKSGSLLAAPFSATRLCDVAGVKTSSFEDFAYGLARDAEALADSSEREALLAKSHSFLEAPGERTPTMGDAVFGTRHHFKIVEGIVKSVPVFVMDNFIDGELSAEVPLHDHAMLKALAAINEDQPILCVPGSHDCSRSFGSAITHDLLKDANPAQGATGRATGGTFNASAQLYTHMGDRNVRTGGATNIAFNVPAGPTANIPVDPNHMKVAQERASRTVHNQRKLYRTEIEAMQTQVELPVVPVVLPDDKIAADEEARREHEERRKTIDRYAERRHASTMSAPHRLVSAEQQAKYYVNIPAPKESDKPGRTGPT